MKVIAVLVVYLAAIGLSIGLVGVLTKIVCWAFGFAFTWRLAVGVWAVIVMASWAFKPNKGK